MWIRNLLQVCQGLHEGRPGGCGDPLSTEELIDNAGFLWMRYLKWQCSPARTAAYDNAVRALLRVSMLEASKDVLSRLRRENPDRSTCVACYDTGMALLARSEEPCDCWFPAEWRPDQWQ